MLPPICRFSSSKYTRMRLLPGLRPEPHCWRLQRSPDHLAGFRGPLSGRGGEERGWEKRRESGALPHFFCYNLTTEHQSKKEKKHNIVFISCFDYIVGSVKKCELHSLSVLYWLALVMDARSASVHVIFCRCFFSAFFYSRLSWPNGWTDLHETFTRGRY